MSGSEQNYTYISDSEVLAQYCQQWQRCDYLAIDTEFVRTRTLYPKLGLLQVYDGNELVLIDPIGEINLTPFWQLLVNEDVVKVLHACSEDLEVFLNNFDDKPVNIIDSQIMMMFLGHGLSLGYAAMVQHFTGIELDKSESRTDWTKRPLSDKQLSYAAADVKYLYEIYPKLLAELTVSPWLSAAKQESQLLIERKHKVQNSDDLYQNIKMAWRLSPKQLNLLKHLATWRYQVAQQRDLPIGFVAKDHTLIALAQRHPKSVAAMANIEGIEVLDVRHKGKAMLRVLNQAAEVSPEQYPEKIRRLDEYPGYKQTFKKVKQFVVKVSQECGLAPETLASKKQINQFLAVYYNQSQIELSALDGVDILSSWRFELFGKKLQELSKNNFAD